MGFVTCDDDVGLDTQVWLLQMWLEKCGDSVGQWSPTFLSSGTAFVEDSFCRDGFGGGAGGDRKRSSGGNGSEGSLARSPAEYILLCHQFLTGPGLVLVHGPGAVGDPWYRVPGVVTEGH